MKRPRNRGMHRLNICKASLLNIRCMVLWGIFANLWLACGKEKWAHLEQILKTTGFNSAPAVTPLPCMSFLIVHRCSC